MKISSPENNGAETVYIFGMNRWPRCESHLDRVSGRKVNSLQTCGYGRGVIGDYQVTGVQVFNKRSTQNVIEFSITIHDQKPCVSRTLNRLSCGNHRIAP